MSATPIRVLGAMSGTSSDGVDIAALEISESPFRISYLGLVSVDFPDAFRETLLTLQNPQQAYSEGDDPFALLASARNELSVCYAQAVKRLLTQLSWEASTVMALGAHGQTIRHNPDAGYTLQILDPALIRHLTGLRVVSDFRSADVALGGQGAPLVPAFHQAWLKSANAFTEVPVCVLNLGGFSNLTILNAKGEVTQGGDCGPANVFLDWFAQQHLNTRCDVNGALAQSGAVHQALLALLMQHPFFKSSWPASTGREHFNLTWLQSILSQFHGLSPEDLMATLVEMAVSAVVRCLDFPDGRLFVCGGGVNNQALMQGLSRRLGAQWSVQATDTVGIAPQAVEAAAFAWLAYCYFTGRDGNSPAVTGASASCVLGVATT